MTYKYYHTNDCGEKKPIGESQNYEEAIDEALSYIENETDYDEDDDGDTPSDVESALRTRGYYIIGYGPECVEIVEEEN